MLWSKIISSCASFGFSFIFYCFSKFVGIFHILLMGGFNIEITCELAGFTLSFQMGPGFSRQ